MKKYFAEKMTIDENGIVERKTMTVQEVTTQPNNEDVEEYLSVYEFEDEDLLKSRIRGPLFFDLDTDLSTRRKFNELKKQVRLLYNCFARWKIARSEVNLFFSGSKGFHFLIPREVLGIGFEKDLNLVNKRLAKTLKEEYGAGLVDVMVYDKKQMLRSPGSINFKSGLYKVPLTFEEFDKISLKQLRELAKNKPEKAESEKRTFNEDAAKIFKNYVEEFRAEQKESRSQKKKISSAPREISSEYSMLPCVKKALRTDCPNGSRNKTAFLLASSLIQKSENWKSVLKYLAEWNDTNRDPLSEKELQIVAIHAFSNNAKGKNHYGCGVFKSEGLCVDSCPLNTLDKAS